MFGLFEKKHDEPSEEELLQEEYRAFDAEIERTKKVEEELKLAELKNEYENDKEYLISELQNNLKSKDYKSAKEIIDKYRAVAIDDNIFSVLAKKTDTGYAIYKHVYEWTALYHATPEEEHEEKLELCNNILSCDPQNQEFIQNKIHELDAIYDATPEAAYEMRLSICNQILFLKPPEIELKQKYTKEHRKVEKAYHKYLKAQNLPARRDKSSSRRKADYRIGRTVFSHKPLQGIYNSTHNQSIFPLNEGEITLWVHTHGISISPALAGSFELNYHSIESMKATELSSLSGGGALAGATAGFLLGGVLGAIGGAIGGAFLGSSSDSVLEIHFKDSPNELSKTLIILTNSQEETRNFIAAYNHEISITKRTGRTPSSLTIGKVIGIGVIVLSIVLIFVIVNASSPKPDALPSQEPENIVQEETTAAPIPEPEPTVPAIPLTDTWTAIDEARCAIANSSGILTAVKSESKDKGWLELQSPLIPDNLNEISLVFDRNTPIKQKCFISDKSTIQINIDVKTLKKMRGATNLKIVIPKTNNTLKFSLMGFSKACEWAK